VNNRTSFFSWLQADQEVTTPTGTSKNDGFATGFAWAASDNINYLVSIVVNHDLNQKVTAIHLHAPAASNTNTPPIVTFDNLLTNAGKVLNFQINSTVFNWLNSHLGYINIHTTTNTDGALRGQFIPTTTRRIKLPTFPNKATVEIAGNPTTFLPDGSAIIGDVGLKLRQGGARNLTGEISDDRVALFSYNASSSSFDNDFRFALPVTIKNRFTLRSALFYVTAAAEVADTNKFNVGLLDLNDLTTVPKQAIPGTGRRVFNSFKFGIDADEFPRFLGPGGVFVNVKGSGLTGAGLFVDQFYMSYYVVNAYANNLMKAIFFKGSSAE